MAEHNGAAEQSHPNLNLTSDEKRVFGQLFAAADTDNIGVVTGEVAVKFFEKTKLAPATLGEIWQIADTENRGLLTPAGFGVVLRLIGHAQAGREPSPELALRPGPIPKFDGITGISNAPSPHAPSGPLQPQASGGPIRVPSLTPDKVNEYTSIFENAGSQNGILPGETAKQIFERARLPNEVLGRVWNLADTEQRGCLDATGFIIAMHLLASYKSGSLRALPQILPPGLYEVASRRSAPQRQMTGASSRPTPGGPPVTGMQRQFSGQVPQRTSSPMARAPYGTPPLSAQVTGNDWAISPQDKVQFDNIYTSVDKANRGFITGDQAVTFFSNSRLPEDILAQIWDMADINSEGKLNRDEFAVAMYLIRQQRGKRDGRSVLPSTLPPNLIPPSMRRQPIRPPQPTAPVFDNASNITAPKSASADLFGLDAISPQVPQSTGGSTNYATSSPQRSQGSPQLTQPSSLFKPFVPSSTFGQNMISSQATGGSTSGAPSHTRGLAQQQSPDVDDLLGDNDPEISKNLTQETTELANLSNQVGTLSKQMQEVKSNRSSTEQELSQASSQKREFEPRLSQLRSLYEQEVKEVKVIEERLSASNNETRKLQQDIAMIEGSRQDLQNQHRQIAGALQADQQENASLKERIRQANVEISELKPQLEKIRSEARQQKGLVAINKKQLATNEAERDKLKGEIGGASRELSEASREAEESKRMAPSPSQVQNPAAVVSPATSANSQSMNPFFRQTQTAASETAMSPISFAPEGGAPQDQSTYDSVFGPSYDSSSPASGQPPMSFRTENPSQSRTIPSVSAPSGQTVRSSEGPDLPTPSTSPPPSSYHESPQTAEPPAPPKSRQITSSFLPFREKVQRSDSVSSSLKVSAPASRFDGDQETSMDTPTGVPPVQGQSTFKGPERTDTNKRESVASRSSSPYLQRTSSASPATSERQSRSSKTAEQRDLYQEFGQPSLPGDIPGAFPGDVTPPVQSQAAGESSGSNRPSNDFPNNRSDPFTVGGDQVGGPKTAKDDFDAAFAGFGAPKSIGERQSSGDISTAEPGKVQREFPPIQEFGANEDSDSASEQGFDDDFTATSPYRRQESSNEVGPMIPKPNFNSSNGSKELSPPRPNFLTMNSNASQLPTPGAQISPPTYDQTVHPHTGEPSLARDANQFPPEFNGLLPSRQDPTSPPPAPQSPEQTSNAPLSGGQALFNVTSLSRDPPTNTHGNFHRQPAPSLVSQEAARVPSDAYHSAFPDYNGSSLPQQSQQSQQSQQPQQPQQPQQHLSDRNIPGDDFDNEFADLADAREADDKGDDDFGANHRDGFDEFNPIFDSPATIKSSTVAATDSTIQPEGGFPGFEHNVGESTQGSNSGQAPQQLGANSSHDWDAIFAGIDTPQGEASKPSLPPREEPSVPGVNDQAGPSSSRIAGDRISSMKPPLGRALTAGTEHDDPILKRLTGMGYPREQSLDALEKFDYNIDKAADYLTSKS